MSAQSLKAELEPVLSSLLGSYQHPDGTLQPAIFAGDPPSTWKAYGLECRIEGLPELTPQRYNAHTKASSSYRIYLVEHRLPNPNPTLIPAADTQMAAVLLVTGFDTSSPTLIPENERIGTLNQYVLTLERNF